MHKYHVCTFSLPFVHVSADVWWRLHACCPEKSRLFVLPALSVALCVFCSFLLFFLRKVSQPFMAPDLWLQCVCVCLFKGCVSARGGKRGCEGEVVRREMLAGKRLNV